MHARRALQALVWPRGSSGFSETGPKGTGLIASSAALYLKTCQTVHLDDGKGCTGRRRLQAHLKRLSPAIRAQIDDGAWQTYNPRSLRVKMHLSSQKGGGGAHFNQRQTARALRHIYF
jgi:hypothetical protein